MQIFYRLRIFQWLWILDRLWVFDRLSVFIRFSKIVVWFFHRICTTIGWWRKIATWSLRSWAWSVWETGFVVLKRSRTMFDWIKGRFEIWLERWWWFMHVIRILRRRLFSILRWSIGFRFSLLWVQFLEMFVKGVRVWCMDIAHFWCAI